MSIQLLFCCICISQALENGFVACWAIAAADWSCSADGGVRWLCRLSLRQSRLGDARDCETRRRESF